MASEEQLTILKQGVEAWNHWRGTNPVVQLDLTGAYLGRANLRGAHLGTAHLREADLRGADLRGAVLTGAYLRGADLTGADLTGAYLTGAHFGRADLREADLTGAYLTGAYLTGAHFGRADLTGAVLQEATIHLTIFANVDLSRVQGLETVTHQGPSTVGIDTIQRSNGNIPEVFLRGCGVPVTCDPKTVKFRCEDPAVLPGLRTRPS
jgi:hypothetical protein